ncbi:MAG: hypothetical protein H7343_05095 [Undibacterium sp.]|nr:hypothetical protein [Opitutaceae bacterium]
MKPKKTRWKRWLGGSLLAVVVITGGYFGGRHYAWPLVKTWRAERMNRAARAFLASGDYANAVLTARKSLKSSTQNAEAWRIAAAASKARDLPEAVSYQDSLCREEPTKENYLELIRLALHFDVPGYALETIKSVGPEARGDANFHRLAAQVYTRTGQPTAARFHLVVLTQLQPADHTAQLDLAEIELTADPRGKDVALRARVLALADKRGLGGRALTLLLRENVTRKVTTGTAELVRRLLLVPDLSVADRLLLIEGQALLGRSEGLVVLRRLQDEVVDKPADAARVLELFIRTGRAAEVAPWFATLPEKTRKDEEVQHQMAEALLVMREASALEAFLRGGRWPLRDYLREAFLAHAYRDLGRSAEFSEAWKQALIGAGADLRKTVALLARVDDWRWVNERHDVVWKLFALLPTNESVQQVLITWERHQNNTANLNRLFARIVEMQPKNDVARNNLAYLSLLLDTNLGRASLMAADLTKTSPKNPFFVTTHALALYKQGHAAEALARLDTLTATERTEPVRMLCRALCLAALGQAATASDLLNGVVLTQLLPEEKRLAERVQTEVARIDRVQGNRSRLLAFRQGREQTTGAAGWLAVVAPETRRNATTDMQLADSLYATGDWPGLRQLLRSNQWRAEDYLRTALLAHAARQSGELSQSRQEWRLALAVADHQPDRLQNLRALVTQWQWAPERMETLNLIFERNATDRGLLAELLHYYRGARRTPEQLRVLGLYVASNGETTDEAVAHAYYSLLLDTNAVRAHVVARSAFEAAPGDTVRRMVYVFSLWKQHRAAEAMPLLAAVPPGAASDLVAIPLLRATILTQLGNAEAARASLAHFNPTSALPEEIELAEKISRQLAAQTQAQAGAVKPPRT